MALAFTGNTFAGQALDMLLTRIISRNETFEGGHVHITQVEDKLIIPRLAMTDIVKNRAATPTSGDSGTPTITQRTLTPLDYMVYLEFNPRDFEHHWFENQMNDELVFRELPLDIQLQFLSELLKEHDKFLGKAIWQGKNTPTAAAAPFDKFDGFVQILDADANTLKVGTPVTLTAANIIAKLKAVYDLTPVDVRNDSDFKMFISPATHELYGDALVALTNKSIAPENGLPTIYRGKKLVPLVGMADNTIVAGIANSGMGSNFWVGVGRGDNENTVLVDRLQNNSELFFMKMLLKVGTQVGFTEETVLYKV